MRMASPASLIRTRSACETVVNGGAGTADIAAAMARQRTTRKSHTRSLLSLHLVGHLDVSGRGIYPPSQTSLRAPAPMAACAGYIRIAAVRTSAGPQRRRRSAATRHPAPIWRGCFLTVDWPAPGTIEPELFALLGAPQNRFSSTLATGIPDGTAPRRGGQPAEWIRRTTVHPDDATSQRNLSECKWRQSAECACCECSERSRTDPRVLRVALARCLSRSSRRWKGSRRDVHEGKRHWII
jgi:hypothetical protein